jgi:ribosome-binding factor A
VSDGGNSRRARVAQTMRDLLAQMIDREVKDPRVREVGLVTVNLVELNRDMSVAYIYVSFFTEDENAIARAMSGLKRSAGFLRGPVARAINLNRAPELRFMHDPSAQFKSRLADIVAEDQERARDAGRDPSDEGEGDDGNG